MVGVVEPATHRRIVVKAQPADVWKRLRAGLDGQGSPSIVFGRTDAIVTFAAHTGEFMLRARVADALMTVCGHGEWRSVFQPLD
jgi:hypothetical protein